MTTRRRTEREPRHVPVGGEAAPEPAPAAAATPRAAASEPAGADLAELEDASAESAVAEQLTNQLEELGARHLRLAADFDNFKRRARQEQLESFQNGGAALAERLLPVLDDGALALEHAPEGVDEAWLKGVELTVQKLRGVLAEAGVERIEAAGAAFDPKFHEAIGTDEAGDLPEDTVTVELRSGYRLGDRILRPALVRVSRKP